jgi:hypothetical protein
LGGGKKFLKKQKEIAEKAAHTSDTSVFVTKGFILFHLSK